MPTLYADDLAYVHHRGFAEHARAATPALLAALTRAGITRGHVLDLGCGGGHWLRALLRAGHRATGIDASAAAIALARVTAPAATLRVGSVLDTRLPRCDAVTALGEVLGYLPPEVRRPPALTAILRRVAAALRPGGILVFDLVVAGRPRLVARSWRAGADWAVLLETEEDVARVRLHRYITTFRRQGAHYRRAFEHHELQIPTRAAVERALRAAGFTARVSRRYGAYELPPRRLAFYARRRD